MQRNRNMRAPKPLDQESLSRLALHYVGRYATTGAKLAAYLTWKIRERGWTGDEPADVSIVVERCATLGYVDDRAFAEMRAQSLGRRGFGGRPVHDALRHAGIASATISEVLPSEAESLAAAEAFARRKKFGRFSDLPADPARRKRELAAMIRAGHSFLLARRFTSAASVADCDECDMIPETIG